MSTTTTATTTQSASGGLSSGSLLGSKLSIISTMQARYEGILTEVDTVAKTMRLKNVKNCGTEGRRGGGSNEILASEQEIQEVLFKIEHIKDFKILEKPNPMLIDDAIVSTVTKKEEEKEGAQKAEEKKGHGKSSVDGFFQEFKKQSPYPQREHHKGGYRGQGGYYRGQQKSQHKGPVGELQENPNELLKEQFKENFDFQSHQLNSKNEAPAEDQEPKASPQEEATDNTPSDSDNKNASADFGFFDSISNSTQGNKNEGGQQFGGHQTRGAEIRKKDVETFGPTAGQNTGNNYKRQGYHNQRGGGGSGYQRGGYYQGGGGNHYQDSGNNNYRGGSGYGRGGGGYGGQYEGSRGGNSYNQGGRGGYHQSQYNEGGAGGSDPLEWGNNYRGGKNSYYRGGNGGAGQGGNSYQDGGHYKGGRGGANFNFYEQRPPGTAPAERGGYKRGGYNSQQQWQYSKPEGAETAAKENGEQQEK